MSDVARGVVPFEPPTIKTRPSFSSAAAWLWRGEERLPARENAFVPAGGLGSKISAVELTTPLLPAPPATRTLPFCRSVAVAPERASDMAPATLVQPLTVGS